MMRTTKKEEKAHFYLPFFWQEVYCFLVERRDGRVSCRIIGCCDGISGWQHFAGVSG